MFSTSSKSQFVLFRSRQSNLDLPSSSLLLAGHQVPLSPSAVCLGVTLSHDLSWAPHISLVRKKGYSVVATIARLRVRGAPLSVLVLVYKALFEPILSYALIVWGGAPKTHLSSLNVLQRDALRAIVGFSRRHSVDHLFIDLDILSLSQLYTLKCATLAFKANCGSLPSRPFLTFPFRIPTPYPLRSFTPSHLRTQRHLTNYRAASPCSQIVAIWNSLPSNVRNSRSFAAFKSSLSIFLLA